MVLKASCPPQRMLSNPRVHSVVVNVPESDWVGSVGVGVGWGVGVGVWGWGGWETHDTHSYFSK